MTFGVNPEAVIADPVPLVTALVEAPVRRMLGVSDQASSVATHHDGGGTAQVQQLIDDTAHIRMSSKSGSVAREALRPPAQPWPWYSSNGLSPLIVGIGKLQ